MTNPTVFCTPTPRTFGKLRVGHWVRFAFLVLSLVTGSLVLAAPYPKEGRLVKWTQPDGTLVTLRVYGDDFYGRTSTKDGYTVVYNEAEKTYYYATARADGTVISSKIAVGKGRPPAEAKDLREPAETIAAIRKQNIEANVPDRAERWATRVKAAQRQRARAAAGFAAAAASPEEAAAAAADAIQAAPVTGGRVGLMILVQFPNDPATAANDPIAFPVTQAKMNAFANEVGYNEDGNTGSIRDYYYDQSDGKMTLTQAVTQVVTLAQPRNYYNYADYPTNSTLRDAGASGRLLVAAAIAKLRADGFDFSTLSLDPTNRVYATSLLFAGQDSGVWAKGLWPHASFLSTQINVGTSASPRYINRYQCTNIDDASPVIGTITHELGHLLMDYPDFYDTDSYDGYSEGIGEHCLMSSGNYRNGGKTPAPIDLYLKDFSGWATITDLTPTQGFQAALPSTGNRGYRIRKPSSTTEYFLVENRGAGDKWAAGAVDKGIMIWHVDTAVTTDNQRQEMTATQHYELSLEQADGFFDLEHGDNRGDTTDLFDNTTQVFGNSTNPNSKWWNGTTSGISVEVQSAPGVSMNVHFGPTLGTTSLVLDPSSQAVPAAGLSGSFEVTANVAWTWASSAAWVTSDEPVSQSANQTFNFTVAPNTAVTNRNAVITLTSPSIVRTFVILQSGLYIDDHGNSAAEATLVGQNSTTNGKIEIPGDNDFFRIDVTGGGWLTVQSTGGTDTFGTLLDATGAELGTDDDGGPDNNFLITYAVNAGTYYVEVKHYDSTQTGSYQFVSSLASSSGLSITPQTMAVSNSGGPQTFNVASNATWTWADNAAWVTSTEASTQNGNQVFSYNVLPNTTLTSRTAIITLTAGSLTAKHTITQAGGVIDDHGNSTATATSISQNSTTPGNIETAGDTDFFKIAVTSTGSLVVQTTGTTDTYGYLLDAGGNVVASDDDSGADTNFQIAYGVAPGTYYVQITHWDEEQTGAYSLVCSLGSSSGISVTPTTQAVGAGGGSQSITVNSNTSWTWTDNATWVTSSEATSQSGNQTFTYNVAANTTSATRTAVITFTAGANTATHTITQIGGSLPDLGDPGTFYSVFPHTVSPGGTVDLGGDVQNFGGGSSGTFVVRFYLSTDTTITGTDYFLGEKVISSMLGGARSIIDTDDLTVPITIPPGVYHVGWIYDAANAVGESNETNNSVCIPDEQVTVGATAPDVLVQTLGNGSQSQWGDLHDLNRSYMDDATLNSPLGLTSSGFDGVGVLATTPTFSMTPLTGLSSEGPMTSTGTASSITATRRVSLLEGRHATDEELTFTNTSSTARNLTLRINDNYGSDADTKVHRTSSGDTIVTPEDTWFVCNDNPVASDFSMGPTLMVSWRFSTNLPAATFPQVPGLGNDQFSINFGTISLAAGQTVTVTIRRELFDTANEAVANGLPVGYGPVITSQPASLGVNPGQAATLNVTATGNGLSYQWYRGLSGVTTTPVGTNSPTYTTPPLSATAYFWVRVTNVEGYYTNSNTATVIAAALPNLRPTQGNGWPDKLVLSKTPGTSVDNSTFTISDSIYVDLGFLNDGSVATPTGMTVGLYVDGNYEQSWTGGVVETSAIYVIEDYLIDPLPAGQHTIKLVLDSASVIVENNETDNEYTRTIFVNDPAAPPAIVTQPANLTVNTGQTATLSVVAGGVGLSYQWYRGAVGVTTTPLGANSPTLTTTGLSTTSNYWVKVTNANGSVNSTAATVTVVLAPGVTATQSATGYYSPGGATIACRINYAAAGQMLSLRWRPELPPGWTLASVSGDGNPAIQDGEIVFPSGGGLPNPIVFDYVADVPAGDSGVKNVGGSIEFLFSSQQDTQVVRATRDPLPIQVGGFHHADYTHDWVVSDTEVLRMLAFWRTGSMHVDFSQVDGYALGAGSTVGATHHADYLLPHWQINGRELNRVLAYWRATGYHRDSTQPDGFAPGLPGVAFEDLPPGEVALGHSAPTAYAPGGNVTVSTSVAYPGQMLALLARPQLPAGWTITSVTGAGSPELRNGEIVWTGAIPPSPVAMSYTVAVPANAAGSQQIRSEFDYWLAGGALTTRFADSDALTLSDHPTNITIAATAAPSDGGTINGLGSGTFIPGANVTLTAVPALGFRFVNWTEGGTAIGEQQTLNFAASVSRTLVANFEVNDSPIVLSNGVPINGISGAAGNAKTFKLTLPPGATNLSISASGGSGDVSLQVRRGVDGPPVTYNANGKITAETANVAFPPAGEYFITLTGVQAYSGVTLKASYAPSTGAAYTWHVTTEPAEGGDAFGNFVGGDDFSVTYPAGATIALGAKAASGYVFKGWMEGGVLLTEATNFQSAFTGDRQLVAVFAAGGGSFAAAAGNYDGLIGNSDQAHATSGFGRVTVKATGKFSGYLILGGKRVALSGVFDPSSGRWNGSVKLNKVVCPLELKVDLNGENQVSGWLSIDGEETVLTALRTGWNTRTGESAPQVGSYTVVLPARMAAEGEPAVPTGFGYGTVTVTKAGGVKLVGKLGDGSAFSQAGNLCRTGQWPVYANLYAKLGTATGWVTFRNPEEANDLDGTIHWIKPARPRDKFYAAGFASDIDVVGSHFAKTKGTTQVIDLGAAAQGGVFLEGGNLAGTTHEQFTLDPQGRATGVPPNASSLKIKISRTTGKITGSFKLPGVKAAKTFEGVILQKQARGGGFFKGTMDYGSMEIAAPVAE